MWSHAHTIMLQDSDEGLDDISLTTNYIVLKVIIGHVFHIYGFYKYLAPLKVVHLRKSNLPSNLDC